MPGKRCPKCGAKFEIVAYSLKYYVVGCPEHHEYDEVISLESDN